MAGRWRSEECRRSPKNAHSKTCILHDLRGFDCILRRATCGCGEGQDDHRMKYLLLLSMSSLFLLTGCAGGFRSDDEYQAYISSLHLSDMSAEKAAARLSEDRFECSSNTDSRLHELPSTYCRKFIGGSLTLIVWLSPTMTDHCKVEASRSFVFA